MNAELATLCFTVLFLLVILYWKSRHPVPFTERDLREIEQERAKQHREQIVYRAIRGGKR